MKSAVKFISYIVFVVGIFIGIIQWVFLLVGPDYKEGTYTLVYRVHYSNSNYSQDTIRHNYPISVYSSRGTNYITITNKASYFKNMFSRRSVFETSAPIQTISYTFDTKKYGD